MVRHPSDFGPFGEFAADHVINLGAPDDPDERAAYFERGAESQDRIAATTDDPEMADIAAMMAEQLRLRARQLRRGRDT